LFVHLASNWAISWIQFLGILSIDRIDYVFYSVEFSDYC
jgi:hypothetical protein